MVVLCGHLNVIDGAGARNMSLLSRLVLFFRHGLHQKLRLIALLISAFMFLSFGSAAYASTGWDSQVGAGVYATPEEACDAQRRKVASEGKLKQGHHDSARTYHCDWSGSLVLPGWVRYHCAGNFQAPNEICPSTYRPAEQCCEDEIKEQSAPNTPSTPNPVSIASGTKTWAEIDYSSEDGLLTINRNYRSRMRSDARQSQSEPDRFGSNWQGTIPGTLVFAPSSNSVAEYLSDKGGIYSLVSSTDPADVVFKANAGEDSQHRLRLEMVAPLPSGMGREQYIASAPLPALAVAEFRLEFPNGAYTLYRRVGNPAYKYTLRTAVAIEHGKASGYKQYYDYIDNSKVPYRIRDSFGRQIGLEWDKTNDLVGRKNTSESAIKKITLPDGSYLEYVYDDGVGRKNPLTVTLAVKNRLRTVQRKSPNAAVLWSRKYHYENLGFPMALTGIEDGAGRRLTTYTYDVYGHVASTESAGGADRHELTHSYPSATRIIRTVKGPLGHVATYEFEVSATKKRYTTSKLLSIKGSANGSVPADEVRYTYLDNRITSATDRRGTVTSYANDPVFGRPAQIKEAAGTKSEQQDDISWHSQWDLPAVTQQDGVRTENTYDAQGRLISRTDIDTTTHSAPYATAGQSRSTNYAWTAQGKIAQMNGPLPPDAQGRDDITAFAYDTGGNLISATNALGHVTTFSGHDANGRASAMTDPNGVITAFGYDPLGRMTSVNVKHPGNAALDAVTALEYDTEGRVTGITLPQTAKLFVDYSAIGRVTALRSGDGERIDFAYDRMGNVIQRTVKRSDGSAVASIKQSYDALGRLVRETLGVGRPRILTYDKDGNVTAVTDPRNFTSGNAFDALGRVVQATNTDGGTETHSYNKRDETVSYKDPVNVISAFVRNGFGDMIQEMSPDRGTSTYTYDAGGQMVSATDGRGQRINYAYDIAGRIVSKIPVGRPVSETISYAYDGAGTGGGLGGYQLGQLTSVSDSSGVTRFAYDHRGNLLQRSQTVGSTANAALTYAYDLADRITQITYPSGRSVRYGNDGKGRVAAVDTRSSAAAAWVMLASNMTYQPFGSAETMTLGNGLIAANDRGLDGRLRGRRLTNGSSTATPVGTKLSDISYGYDPDGNVTSMEDKVTPARSSLYGYDAGGRVNMMVAEGSNAPANYTYTQGTNQLASVTTSIANTPAATRTVQYDARGNPTSETRNNGAGATQAVTIAYDGHGRMTGYARSGEVSLTHSYNGNDDRISTTTTSAATATPDTRRFVYAPDGRVLGEYGSSASDVRAEFIWLSPQVGDAGSFGGDDGEAGRSAGQSENRASADICRWRSPRMTTSPGRS